MNVLINYANARFRKAQVFNSKTARRAGGFDEVIEYTPERIDPAFARAHQALLTQPKGAGLWLWKPWIVLHTLEKMCPGEVLMYCDAGSFFVASAAPLRALTAQTDIVTFELEHPEYQYTRHGVLQALDPAGTHRLTRQRTASYFLVRKTPGSTAFFEELLSLCVQPALLEDPNPATEPQLEGFRAHRHDQSLLSLLAKQHPFPAFRDPSQWGNLRAQAYANSPYGQIIEHTRSPEPKQAKLLWPMKKALKNWWAASRPVR